MKESIAEYEVKHRRSRVVPLMHHYQVEIPFGSGHMRNMVSDVGDQWCSLYRVPPEKVGLIPRKGDLMPGEEIEAVGKEGAELEAANKRDLFKPRVKDVKDQGMKEGFQMVILHIAQPAPFEEKKHGGN